MMLLYVLMNMIFFHTKILKCLLSCPFYAQNLRTSTTVGFRPEMVNLFSMPAGFTCVSAPRCLWQQAVQAFKLPCIHLTPSKAAWGPAVPVQVQPEWHCRETERASKPCHVLHLLPRACGSKSTLQRIRNVAVRMCSQALQGMVACVTMVQVSQV